VRWTRSARQPEPLDKVCGSAGFDISSNILSVQWLLHDSRRGARVDAAGALVTLEEQDRTLWDGAQIGQGLALVEKALRMGRAGAYQLQAAIAALHAEAHTPPRPIGRRSSLAMALRGVQRCPDART
jgi:predicted RNA polymerase sigma factor